MPVEDNQSNRSREERRNIKKMLTSLKEREKELNRKIQEIQKKRKDTDKVEVLDNLSLQEKPLKQKQREISRRCSRLRRALYQEQGGGKRVGEKTPSPDRKSKLSPVKKVILGTGSVVLVLLLVRFGRLPSSIGGFFPGGGTVRAHTYELDLSSTVDEVKLSRFVVSGEEEAAPGDFVIDYEVTVGGTTPANKLHVEHLTVSDLSAESLEISGVEIVNFKADRVRADGISFHQTPKEIKTLELVARDTYPSITEDNYAVDKVRVVSSDAEGYVENMVLDDFEVRGSVILQQMVIGTLTLKDITVGAGDGLAEKDFVVSDTFIKNEVGVDIQEELIKIK